MLRVITSNAPCSFVYIWPRGLRNWPQHEITHAHAHTHARTHETLKYSVWSKEMDFSVQTDDSYSNCRALNAWNDSDTDLKGEKFLLGACAELRKATISFVGSVRLSVCLSRRSSSWNHSAPAGQIFIEMYYLSFSKICLENSSFINLTGITCTVHEHLCTLTVLYRNTSVHERLCTLTVLYMNTSVHLLYCTWAPLYLNTSVHLLYCTWTPLYTYCTVHEHLCTWTPLYTYCTVH
jgi:hypothetical protein